MKVDSNLLRNGLQQAQRALDAGDVDGAVAVIGHLAAYADGDKDAGAILEMDAEVDKVKKALAYRTEMGQAKLEAEWQAQRKKGEWPWEN
jgi:hypothetical protein